MNFLSFITCIGPQLNSKNYEKLLQDIGTKAKIKNVLESNYREPPIEYIHEMGGKLEVQLWILSNIDSIIKLCDLKRFLIDIEEKYSNEGKRKFNLNPGYLTNEGLFLLTHKPNTLRGGKKLSIGIWSENQLENVNGKLIFTNNTFSEFLNESRLEQFQKTLDGYN